MQTYHRPQSATPVIGNKYKYLNHFVMALEMQYDRPNFLFLYIDQMYFIRYGDSAVHEHFRTVCN